MPSGNASQKAVDYGMKDADAPRSSGAMLSALIFFSEFGMTKNALRGMFLKSGGFTHFREKVLPTENPTPMPIHFGYKDTEGPADIESSYKEGQLQYRASDDSEHRYWTVADYHQRYVSGTITPTDVAKAVIECIKKSNNEKIPLRAIVQCNEEDVLAQAKESTERYKNGKFLSVFDGVPVTIKVEIDQKGYGTTVGTKFLGKTPAEEDGTVVARLREAGALLVGKSNMHEIGLGVTGGNTNPGAGFARNAYGFPNHYAGGSSGGSGAAVASGLVPIAIGADGGGSVRIPSAFCGGVGMKCTFGRVSEHGAYPLCWSVAHVGPMTANAVDNALLYALISGRDENDPNSQHQPTPSLDHVFDSDSLEGLRIGIYDEWFDHADEEVVKICKDMVSKLEGKGATVVKIALPELEESRIAHATTICSEMSASMEHHYNKDPSLFTKETRAMLSLAQEFTARDYIKAQRQRTRAMKLALDVLKDVDMIATPTTGCVAPAIPKDAVESGEMDVNRLSRISRFAGQGNFTGLPAIAFVSGYDSKQMPVSLQLMGRPWEESRLLHVAVVADRMVPRVAPPLYYDIIAEAERIAKSN